MRKKLSKIKSKIGPLLNPTGNLTQRNKEMAEILSQQYVKVFSNPTVHTERDAIEDNGINKISTTNITENDLIKAISELHWQQLDQMDFLHYC